MWSRLICIAVISLGLAPQANAGEPLFHRVSCTAVRFYVARYTVSAAEAWARNHGATETDIQTARLCLKKQTAQTAQATQ
jgi:hypothetical protein